MRSFFGLPVNLLTDIHCPTNTDNVTHLPAQGMDIFDLNEDSLDADHEFGMFWRKYGQAQADVTWLHLPEFDEEDADTGPSIGIIGVCEDDITVLVQEITELNDEEALWMHRSVFNFFGQTFVTTVVRERDESRVTEWATTVALDALNNEVTLRLYHKEDVADALFGARCQALIKYIECGKQYDRLVAMSAPEMIVANQTRFLRKNRIACADLFVGMSAPEWTEVDFAERLIGFLANFGVSEMSVRTLLASQMPDEAGKHISWNAKLVRKDSHWSPPTVEIVRNDDGALTPPPIDDDPALRLMAEAQQVVLGFEQMVKLLPDAAASARSFNRPVKVTP